MQKVIDIGGRKIHLDIDEEKLSVVIDEDYEFDIRDFTYFVNKLTDVCEELLNIEKDRKNKE
jgi:hypothetical protein